MNIGLFSNRMYMYQMISCSIHVASRVHVSLSHRITIELVDHGLLRRHQLHTYTYISCLCSNSARALNLTLLHIYRCMWNVMAIVGRETHRTCEARCNSVCILSTFQFCLYQPCENVHSRVGWDS